MEVSAQDRSALQCALKRLYDATQASGEATTTDDARRALMAVRDAAINAQDVINRVEDNTRQQAFVDLSERLQQQVGMEPESL